VDRVKMQKVSGILQILWGIGAFVIGALVFSVFLIIVSGGGIFGEGEPLDAFGIMFFIAIGFVIVFGCGSTVFLGVRLANKARAEKKKTVESIISIIMLCVPPLVAVYSILRTGLPIYTIIVSPVFLALIAPLVMVLTNLISLFLKPQQNATGSLS